MTGYGKKMQVARHKKGETMAESAAGIGITERSYRAYEQEERLPRAEIMSKIAAYFGIPITKLFFSE